MGTGLRKNISIVGLSVKVFSLATFSEAKKSMVSQSLSLNFRDIQHFLGQRVLDSRISFPECHCAGVSSVDELQAETLVFVTDENSHILLELDEHRLENVLLLVSTSGAQLLRERGNWIAVDSPRLEFGRVARQFLVARRKPKISSLATISSNAKLGSGISVGAGCVIGDAVIGSGTIIGPNCVIEDGVSIGMECYIGPNCSIGQAGFGYERESDGKVTLIPHLGGVRIGHRVHIGANSCVDRGTIGDTVIEDDVKIDNLVHVAHNVIVGRGTFLIAHSMIGGSVRVGQNAWIAPSSTIINGKRVGDDAVVGLGAVVIRDVEPGTTVVGNPARSITQANRGPA